MLITGGTGFIGRHLVRELASRGHKVTTLSRSSSALPEATHLSMNVLDPEVAKAFQGTEAVVHLAGPGDVGDSFERPLAFGETNVLGTMRLLEAARDRGAAFLLASTQRVYRPSPGPLSESDRPEPSDPYGLSKLLAEQWTNMYHTVYGVATSVVRLFSVYGPGQVARGQTSGVVAIFMRMALQGHPIRIKSIQRRDFTYVADAVRGIALAMESPLANGKTYNVATGRGTLLADLAREILETTGSIASLDAASLEPAQGHYVADIGLAAQELGYRPEIDLRKGLSLYARWFKDYLAGSPESAAPPGAAC